MSAVYHQGENIYITSRITEPGYGSVALDLYTPKVIITDRWGEKVLDGSEVEGIEVFKGDEEITLLISNTLTTKWEGLFYVSVELWYNGQKLITNELNKIEIIR